MSTDLSCDTCNRHAKDVVATRDSRTNIWTVRCAECEHSARTADLPTMGGLTQAGVTELLAQDFGLTGEWLTDEQWMSAVARYEHWMNPNVFGHPFAACLAVTQEWGVRLPSARRSSR